MKDHLIRGSVWLLSSVVAKVLDIVLTLLAAAIVGTGIIVSIDISSEHNVTADFIETLTRADELLDRINGELNYWQGQR